MSNAALVSICNSPDLGGVATSWAKRGGAALQSLHGQPDASVMLAQVASSLLCCSTLAPAPCAADTQTQRKLRYFGEATGRSAAHDCKAELERALLNGTDLANRPECRFTPSARGRFPLPLLAREDRPFGPQPPLFPILAKKFGRMLGAVRPLPHRMALAGQ